MHRIFDAHLDIAWNALSFDRDQLLPLEDLRRNEEGMTGSSRGNCTVSLPEMRLAHVRVCLATLLCRAMPPSLQGENPGIGPVGERGHGEVILREDLDFANQAIAYATAQGQLAYYFLLDQKEHVRIINWQEDVVDHWSDPRRNSPIGIILSMEGCDPILEPSHVPRWFEQGLRTACLAHYGQSAYAMGTGGDGPLTPKGKELLREFEKFGMLLDLVHTADTAFQEALDWFRGPVFVSHANCRALVEHDRQLSDRQIQQVAGRDGVVGVVMDEWMLVPGYERGLPGRTRARLEDVADHIDHICNLLGTSRHVGIGSDLDGGFGTEQTPTDLNSIQDLQKIGDILSKRGYSDSDVTGVMNGNWQRFFTDYMPKYHQWPRRPRMTA